MSNRQYIGARYVPAFADPIEWNENIAYEPLTIVSYLGASYTSKKAVPAGVLPTDTSYWVITGNYNAQIEEYRQIVDKLSSAFTSEYEHKTQNFAADIYGNALTKGAGKIYLYSVDAAGEKLSAIVNPVSATDGNIIIYSSNYSAVMDVWVLSSGTWTLEEYANIVTISTAAYNALSDEEKNSQTLYIITDPEGDQTETETTSPPAGMAVDSIRVKRVQEGHVINASGRFVPNNTGNNIVFLGIGYANSSIPVVCRKGSDGSTANLYINNSGYLSKYNAELTDGEEYFFTVSYVGAYL